MFLTHCYLLLLIFVIIINIIIIFIPVNTPGYVYTILRFNTIS